MALPKFVSLLLHGERRAVPRSADATEALRRKRTVEQRLRRLEMDLAVQTGKGKRQP